MCIMHGKAALNPSVNIVTMKKPKLILAVLMMMPLLASAVDGGVVVTDIPYSPNKDDYSVSRCRLDIYYHPEAGSQPVVVWFHGGGLTGGERFIPAELKNAGYTVVAPNYRLIPNVNIEECIDDAAAAVAWTFTNVDKYNGDPRQIFVAGHSAGGYLTSMIGLEKQWLGRYGIDADSIAGLIPFSGQVITHFAQRKREGIGELQPTVDRFAPLFHIRPDAAPYVIITGDSELELYGRYEENLYMWRMLNLIGHKRNRIYKLDGYDHGAMAHPAFHILKRTIRDIIDHKL